MSSCWQEEVTKRPSFPELQAKFDNMLSAHGNNPYIDLSAINPDNLCYTVEADESENSLNVLPSKRLPSGLGRPLSSHMAHISTETLLQGSKNDSTEVLQRSCSPLATPLASEEKPHSSSPMLDKDVFIRPSSMILLHSLDSEENRYVKEPSSTLALPGDGEVIKRGGSVRVTSKGHVTSTKMSRSHDALMMAKDISHPPPKIEITEN